MLDGYLGEGFEKPRQGVSVMQGGNHGRQTYDSTAYLPNMNKAIQKKKLVIFFVTAGAAYVGLFLAGRGAEAWQTVLQQLQALLSMALGAIVVLLAPRQAINPGAPPDPPADPQNTNYQAVAREVEEWRIYGAKAKAYMDAQDAACRHLDMKQTVLRTSLFGIIGLAFFLCLAGFTAPNPTGQTSSLGPEAAFLRHLGYLAAAFALGGVIIGTVIDRIRVPTTARHAFRSALIAASILSVSSLLVSLPYVFDRMLQARLTFGGIALPALVWMALFRIVVAPLACAFVACLGFKLAEGITGGSTSRP
jgi:hypothetical protein